MSGNLVSLRVADVIRVTWREPPALRTTNLNNNDTFVLIFSIGQHEWLSLLEADRRIKIVYKAPLAVNRNPYHGEFPRNKLVVFEYDA